MGMPRKSGRNHEQVDRQQLDPSRPAVFLPGCGPPDLAPSPLPWQDCSYFNSNAVPLKLSFQNVDPLGENIRVIFKVRTFPPAWWDGGGRGEGRREPTGGRSIPRAVLFLLLHAIILFYLFSYF